MSVLGYDLGLLAALHGRLRTAIDDLAALRCDDPVAAGALGVVTTVMRSLEFDRLPDLVAIVASDPLGAGSHQLLGAAAGWDWLPGPASGSPIDHRAWAAVFDDLAARRMRVQELLVWDPENAELRDELAAIDAEIEAQAVAYAELGRAHGSTWPRALAHASPMAAALVLGHLDLSDAALARLSRRVLARWHAGGEHGERFADWFLGGDNTADVLFRLLAERPAAATEFLLRVTPDELFRSAQHDEVVGRLVVTATSPQHVDETTAGEILRPLLDWLPDHPSPGVGDGLTRSAAAIVATAITPWLGALGPRAERWGWTYDDGDEALRWLLDDPLALAALTEAAGVWQERLRDTPLLGVDGRLDGGSLRDLASTLAQVQIALRDAEIAQAEADALVAQLALNAASIAISAAVPGGAVAVAADMSVGLFTPLAVRVLDRWGVAPSVAHARADAQDGFGDRAVDAAVIAVTGIVAQAIDRGDLPPGTLDLLDLDDLSGSCTPRAVGDRLHAFVGRLEPMTDAATHHALLAVVYAFGNPLSDAQLCA